ncbi:hypothetical protein QQF64_011584 [Cirrhinus molitorella]|uniref:Uncharacterized protein n=1 Tax=Cirrhinus molitorella TaxID=172907 RepID=A0ABR3M1A3_9TELE
MQKQGVCEREKRVKKGREENEREREREREREQGKHVTEMDQSPCPAHIHSYPLKGLEGGLCLKGVSFHNRNNTAKKKPHDP